MGGDDMANNQKEAKDNPIMAFIHWNVKIALAIIRFIGSLIS